MKGLIINKYGLSHVEKYVHPMEIVGNFDIFETCKHSLKQCSIIL